jgi:hypothetical protein
MEQTCPCQTYYPVERRNAKRDQNAAYVAAETPVLLGCGYADFTVHADPSQSSEAVPILNSDTVARQLKRDSEELKV